MTNDPIPFLANIIAVAGAGSGQPSSSAATATIEAIRSELGYKKGDLTKAQRLVEPGNYELTPIGNFADRVKNLECMLRVAYADDSLDHSESDLIAAFCHKIGVYQDQLDRLIEEILAARPTAEKRCVSCGGAVPSGGQFCPQCGTPIAPIPKPSNPQTADFQIPTTGIVIEFADSTSGGFQKALELARSSDRYETVVRQKKNWHFAVFSSGRTLDALPLAGALSGIRNRRVYLDGAEASWDEIFGFAWCATQRALAYRPVEYCFGKDENRINPWGCKQAMMDWTDWSQWFTYGKWERGGLLGPKLVWRFDKERIRHEVATRLFKYRHCPHLDSRLPEMVLKLLPETVCPERDPNWSYSRQYEEAPGSVKVVERESIGGFSSEHSFWADGVRPKGHQVISKLLTDAFAALGYTATNVQKLLS